MTENVMVYEMNLTGCGTLRGLPKSCHSAIFSVCSKEELVLFSGTCEKGLQEQ